MDNSMKHTDDWIRKTNENMNEFIEFEHKKTSNEDISMHNTTQNRRGKLSLCPKHNVEMIHSETILHFIYETKATIDNLTMRISELETEIGNLKKQC
tara:strand:+ start:1169 stop:1459 length:291 start_codon:yes stop_codon:yes gene_type:complete